ncbi:MAG: hypothetical protein ACR2NU_01210 [Aeoliella sp.]
MIRRTVLAILLTSLVVGCSSRFHDKRNETLEVGAVVDYAIPATGQARSIHVTATVVGGPVDVYVYLADDQDEAQRMITLGKPSDTFLTSSEATNNVDVTAEIPPNQEAFVTVRTAGREESQLELTMSD